VAVTGNLLLVIQEAVHNALHHAAPRIVAVEAHVDRAAGTLAVTVRDDGAGFAPGAEPGPKQGHFGLAGMQERVGRLGGTFSIASSPGRGTAVAATVPLAGPGFDRHVEDRP
jgi:signal transduction histidine kinase